MNKNVLLCVTGSIAAYKMPELVGSLVEEGAQVKVVMTKAAERFVTPLTMEIKSKQKVPCDLFDYDPEVGIEHVEFGKWADMIVIAPATANIIGKLAHGMADDLTTCTCLATQKPVLIFPAMNTNMWLDEMVQKNVQILNDSLKYRVFEPVEGQLACGVVGIGKMRSDLLEIILGINKYELKN